MRETLVRLGLPALLAAAAAAASPAAACTAICVDEGDACVFGFNFDFAYEGGQVLVNPRGVVKAGLGARSGPAAAWTSRYGSLTVSLHGHPFAFLGMNEAGLVGTTLLLPQTRFPAPDARPAVPFELWLQYQLDTHATVAEVLADETVQADPGPGHFFLCDRTGACAAVEFLDGRRVVRTGRELPVRALANAPFDESLAAWRGGERALADPVVRFMIAADLLTGHARQEEGRRRTERLHPPAPSDAAVHYAFYTLASVARQETAWTLVLDPGRLRVHLVTRRNPRPRWIDLARLDLDGPLRMLDVQADLDGDLTDRIPAYDHDRALAHALEATGASLRRVAQLLPPSAPPTVIPTPEEIEAYLRQVEAFPRAGEGARE